MSNNAYTLDFKGIENENDLQLLTHPHTVVIQEELNQASTLSARYFHSFYPESFSKKSSLKFPSNLALSIEIEDKKFCAFRGPIHSYAVQSQKDQSFVELQFIDPLVTTFEINEPTNWEGQALNQIVDSLLKTSYKPGASGRSFKCKFLGSQVPSPKFLSNTGLSKYDFFKEVILGRFGYHFYFDHSNDQDETLVFFRPEVKPAQAEKVNAGEIFGGEFSFRSLFNQRLDEVHVHSDISSSEKPMSSLSSDFSAFSKATLAARNSNGIELVSHYYFPNEETSFCKDLAQSKLIESALQSNRLSFKSEQYFKLGSYLQVQGGEKEAPPLFEGYYLISGIIRTLKHGRWSHEYRGMRA